MEQLAQIDSTENQSDEQHPDLSNDIAISSILIHDKQFWIGTSMGILYVFDYSLTRKLTGRSSARSNSFTGNKDENHRTKQRSQSDSGVFISELEMSSSSEGLERETSEFYDSVSPDEQHSIEKNKSRRFPSVENSFPSRLSFNLSFKAKIADTPVKSICKTKSISSLDQC